MGIGEVKDGGPSFDLVDIGANLAHDSFDSDRDEVIERAANCGVRRLIITGSSAGSSEDAAKLAASRPGLLYATAGVHPHHASEYTPEVHDRLLALAHSDPIVAVGECGLDYFRDFSPRQAQQDAFAAQLALAASTGLPLFLHQRDAHADFVSILGPMIDRVAGGVAHCFTGDAAALRAYLDMGLYIGITGWICDERRGSELRELASEIPLDRLMIESDAPYLLPRTLQQKPRTRRNEPMYLREVLRVFAEASGVPERQIADATTRNAERLFAL
ncbi:MAG TPA: TatD family hydrolase [Woeseiaceae bacterium]|nr:TatD family hydrolase [Woeseiaceae bacterium]